MHTFTTINSDICDGSYSWFRYRFPSATFILTNKGQVSFHARNITVRLIQCLLDLVHVLAVVQEITSVGTASVDGLLNILVFKNVSIRCSNNKYPCYSLISVSGVGWLSPTPVGVVRRGGMIGPECDPEFRDPILFLKLSNRFFEPFCLSWDEPAIEEVSFSGLFGGRGGAADVPLPGTSGGASSMKAPGGRVRAASLSASLSAARRADSRASLSAFC
jgi:hypothetical protein